MAGWICNWLIIQLPSCMVDWLCDCWFFDWLADWLLWFYGHVSAWLIEGLASYLVGQLYSHEIDQLQGGAALRLTSQVLDYSGDIQLCGWVSLWIAIQVGMWLTSSVVGWLGGQLAIYVIGWLPVVGWLAGCLTSRLAGFAAGWQCE